MENIPPELMAAILEYIEALTHLGHPVRNLLRSGLDPDVIRQFESEASVRLPDELVELYTIHDGTDFAADSVLGHGQLIHGFYFMPFAEAIEAKEIIDEAIADSPFIADESHAFEGRSVFPFLADGCGDHVVVDASPESGRFGWVGTFIHAGDSRPDEFRSLKTLIQAHLEALRNGVCKISDEGCIVAEFEKLEAVLAKHTT